LHLAYLRFSLRAQQRAGHSAYCRGLIGVQPWWPGPPPGSGVRRPHRQERHSAML